ncbi:MAG: BtrH N-terminal domain-containing protein [Acidimicrobiia bacterium]|nr:BtrH N-terminal domain-containing protein [Acidimicrobiia bacterium]
MTKATAELKPLPGFASLETWHCVTGSMRHVYVFHGQPCTEDLLLGLGAGVGFIYWHMKGLPPMIGGRGNVGAPGEEGLEKTAGRRTGVGVEVFRITNTRKAERTLLELLEAGEPVMVQLDMGFLPYFDLPDDFHFGGHVAVVAGYDPATRTVLMADRDRDLHPVSLDTLALARGSTFKPFPPRNQWYTFDFGAASEPQPAEVHTAIHEVVDRMLRPPISNAGVKGASARPLNESKPGLSR